MQLRAKPPNRPKPPTAAVYLNCCAFVVDRGESYRCCRPASSLRWRSGLGLAGGSVLAARSSQLTGRNS
eukprot:4635412-Alexandrium_andersonii.AAC.1